ncbi:MAG: ribonuclease J [Deltaproteobacteria bacterium]|nr:ribonuclease J [Deltaproteobacteria bacterium]
MLKIIPLGGLGEIGLNMMVFEYKDSMFIIDAGLMFPEDYMLGVDLVVPDISYIRANRSKLLGIVLTHAHEDHIGALPYLLKEINAPVFGTSFTIGLVKKKLEDHGLLSSALLHEITTDETLKIGEFELEFISVNHSIVGGVGISIMTPYGRIIHTGDFKISSSSLAGIKTDVNRFAKCGEQGVLALLSDSTNVEREGYTKSAQEIAKTLSAITAELKGRVIVALFASNISRIQQIIDIAKHRGRKVAFIGRSIESNVKIAKELGYLNVPDNMEISVGQINSLSDKNILMLMTGSQGEPMSALTRMAEGRHAGVKIKKDDTVILSSKFIPGNERAITNIINKLYRFGADVIYEKISMIHISGHAFKEELKLMINLTKPEYFIPIHGEYRHLILHARLAKEVGIKKENVLVAENGHIIEFDENGLRLGGKVSMGRVLIDGKGVGDVGKSVLKERRSLSKEGFVAVTMAFDEETGFIIYGPEISSRGFVFETETGHLLQDAECVILEIVEEIGPDEPDRIEHIRRDIKKKLKKYFYFAIKRRPVILPFIIEV